MLSTQEKFDELKKQADEAPVKYKQALNVLKNYTFKGSGEFWYVSAEYNKVNYTFKLKPKSFRVMIRVGEPTLYLACDVIFTKLDFDKPELKKLIQMFKESGITGDSWKKVSSLFVNAPDSEFQKFKRLVNMTDLSLLIDEIIVEDI